MDSFKSLSPLKILEKTSRKGLGPGNLGVLIARAGVGKTACLIHIAFDKIFRQEKLVHLSFDESPEKVSSYYRVMYYELEKAINFSGEPDYRLLIDRNRLILAYLNQSFTTERFHATLKDLGTNLGFKPDSIIVDGLDFDKMERALFEEFKDIAKDFEMEVWFSALSHRHLEEMNEKGIPYPCHNLEDLFSVIIQLRPEKSGVFLRLLKDHDNPAIPDATVRVDPNTFLVMD